MTAMPFPCRSLAGRERVGLSIENGEKVGKTWGEAFRCQCGSCASVASWRCSCIAVSKSCILSNKKPGWQRSQSLRGQVVPDSVARPEADPLGNRAVLLLSFGKLLLGAEGLVALLCVSEAITKERSGRTYRHRDGCRVVEMSKWESCEELAALDRSVQRRNLSEPVRLS